MSVLGRVAIVGVGLIGGSIGLAITRRGLAERVIGIGRQDKTLAAALASGAIAEKSLDLASGVAGANLVIVCTPVGRIAEDVLLACRQTSGAVVTDVGSTKAGIIRQVEEQLCPQGRWIGKSRFCGSHPIAGSEQKGNAHARADLFEGRTCVITPTEATDVADAKLLSQFWTALGMQVVTMTPDEHDRALATISHAPHVIAAALAAATPAGDVPLAAGGWLDTTRIAAGDALLWQQILLANSDHVLASIDTFESRLAAFRRAIESADAGGLEKLLAEAKQVRDAVGS